MSSDSDAQEALVNPAKEGTDLTPEKLELLRGMLDQAEHYLRSVRHLLFNEAIKERARSLDSAPVTDPNAQIIEGVFDGEGMVDPTGRHYPVPPNYASKSKLVAGDVLKLTIAADGTFIYKQIHPVERKKLIAVAEEAAGRFTAHVDTRTYNLLTAAATYYRVKAGDRMTIIVPKEGDSEWAAVENSLEESVR